MQPKKKKRGIATCLKVITGGEKLLMLERDMMVLRVKSLRSPERVGYMAQGVGFQS